MSLDDIIKNVSVSLHLSAVLPLKWIHSQTGCNHMESWCGPGGNFNQPELAGSNIFTTDFVH
jgi:hypothetical protein